MQYLLPIPFACKASESVYTAVDTEACAMSYGLGCSWLQHAAGHVPSGIVEHHCLQLSGLVLQDNVRYGNEAQLLGGYSAGWLLLSAATALAYLGLWLRCALMLRRLTKATT